MALLCDWLGLHLGIWADGRVEGRSFTWQHKSDIRADGRVEGRSFTWQHKSGTKDQNLLVAMSLTRGSLLSRCVRPSVVPVQRARGVNLGLFEIHRIQENRQELNQTPEGLGNREEQFRWYRTIEFFRMWAQQGKFLVGIH
jgi:hypothetical protein